MSLTGPAAVDSILAQPGKGMAAQHTDRTISQAEQDEYECVPSCSTNDPCAIEADMCGEDMNPSHRTSRSRRTWSQAPSQGSR